MDTLKLKKSWEIALGPAKQLPMQAIMGYMSGNGLQIFSIMMVFMLYGSAICYFTAVSANNIQVQESFTSDRSDERYICEI